MWYVCAFYNVQSPIVFFIGKYVIYISCPGWILPLHLNYNGVCIDMFVHLIRVLYWYFCAYYNGIGIVISVYVIPPNCWLYFTLVFLFYISPLHGLFHHCTIITSVFSLICLWMWCLCLLQYVLYFTLSDPWLRYILGNSSCIFPVYYLLFHSRHTCWPTFKIVV